MPQPNEYLGIKALQTAVRAIRVEDGYYYDVAACAVKLDPDHEPEKLVAPDGPRPIVWIEVLQDDPRFFPASQARITTPVTIHWVNDFNPEDDNSLLQMYFRALADLERALYEATEPAGVGQYFSIPPRMGPRRHEIEGTRIFVKVDVPLYTHRTYGQPNVSV